MVRQWQDMNYGGRHSASTYSDSLPDFVKLAESYGHIGMKVTKKADLKKTLDKAFSMKNKLVFVDVPQVPDSAPVAISFNLRSLLNVAISVLCQPNYRIGSSC